MDQEMTPLDPCEIIRGQKCEFGPHPLVDVAVSAGPFDRCRVFQCRRCGHGKALPVIEDVSVLYDGRVTQDYQVIDSRMSSAIKRRFFRRDASKMLSQAGFDEGTIVDFGCGAGMVTEELARITGQGSRVVGMDFFPDPPARLSRAQYLPFAEKDRLGSQADLLVCMHVVEHDNVPVQFLKGLRALMKPSARAIIEVPNIACPWASYFKGNWDNWYLPFHRQHFSRQSFDACLQAAGFTIEKRIDVSIPSMGRTIARSLGRANTSIFVVASGILMPVQQLVEKKAGEPSALRAVVKLAH